jgi:hypothetical protein
MMLYRRYGHRILNEVEGTISNGAGKENNLKGNIIKS